MGEKEMLASRYKCPCASFATSEQVISALSSNEEAARLIQWIQGSSRPIEGSKFEKIPLAQQQLCDHSSVNGQPSRCIRRVGAAYCILNAIRDACRVHLEKEQGGSTDFDRTAESGATSRHVPKYEEVFPSLSAASKAAPPNILKPKKKLKKKISIQPVQLSVSEGQPAKEIVSNSVNGVEESSSSCQMKEKRRVRPAQITSKQQSPWGNISNIQNELPAASPWPAIQSNSDRVQPMPVILNVKSKAKPLTKSTPLMKPITGMMAPKSYKDPMDRMMKGNGLMHPSLLPTKTADPMNRMMGNNSTNGFQSQTMQMQNTQVEPIEITSSKGKSIEPSSTTSTSLNRSPTSFAPPTKYKEGKSLGNISLLRDNTVNAYSAIITSQLSPSIALELQLMLRLITVNDEDYNVNGNIFDNKQKLEGIFDNPESCREFAAQVFKCLMNLIVNLERNILLKLLGLRAFAEKVPDVATNIQQSLESHRSSLLSEGKCDQVDANSGLLVSGKSTILTTPFLEKRDSRHNYRSRDLSSMYNNREQCRDTFLFQLRAFQQMRGTVLNPTQVQRSLDGIQQALRQMMSNLLSSNIPWFAELFTDLLLQIGLVPTQELDADILKNVTDKDRLQKLHSRFTSKVAQKNKSSKPLVLRDNSRIGPSPEHFFTGHQEFFFMFITSMDSYSFNLYLQKRLVHMIMNMTSSNDSRGFEQRVRELQLLAKFLGLLAFSPNWDIKESETTVFDYFTPVIPINEIIEDGYTKGIMVSIIPWILDFLWMMSWDNISMKQPYYRNTFGMLRSIHRNLNQSASSGYSHLATNLLSVGLQLDTFFADVIGLADVERLPEWILGTPKYNENQDVLDASPLELSKQYSLSLSTHLDDLHKLVSYIAVSGQLVNSSRASKKLKPYSLSSNIINTVSLTGSTSTSERFDALGPLEQGSIQGFLSQNKMEKIEPGYGRLIDAFFHQHKNLQQLCEFVIDFSIEHILSKACLDDYIIPDVMDAANSVLAQECVQLPIELDWYLTTLLKIEREAGITIQFKCQRVLVEYISNAINSLVPCNMNAKIKGIAISLSLNHALRKADLLTASLIRTESKRGMDSLLNVQKKKNRTVPTEIKLISFGRDIFCSIEALIFELNGSCRTTGAVFELSLIENIIETLAVFGNSCRTFDASSHITASSLLETMISTTLMWLSPDKDLSRSIRGFKQCICLVSMLGALGLASKEVVLYGQCLSRPYVLKKIVEWNSDFDLPWFYVKCVSGKLIESSSLLNHLMSLLYSNEMSQDAVLRIMILVQKQRG